jgi:hypothetical protein
MPKLHHNRAHGPPPQLQQQIWRGKRKQQLQHAVTQRQCLLRLGTPWQQQQRWWLPAWIVAKPQPYRRVLM